MASRLSEENLRGALDTGHRALSLKAPLPEFNWPTVDLDLLLQTEDAMEAVHSVPPQPLYQALVDRGPEDALEVLELLSHDQLTRILDYDAWSQDQLEPIRMIRWLSCYKELGPEQFAKRFKDLEEEYQLALMGPLVEVFDVDQYETMSDVEQDALHPLPCRTLYYKLKTEDPRLVTFVESLVEAMLATDLNYAYALLTHASFMPPHEPENEALRFRTARLEEDGFVSYQESLTYFDSIDLGQMRQNWDLLLAEEPGREGGYPLVPRLHPERSLLQDVMAAAVFSPEEYEGISRGFAVLANAVCAAAKVTPDDLKGLKQLFGQVQSLSSLGLEWLAHGQAEQAVKILRKESPQRLFRTGLSLVRRLAQAAGDVLERAHVVGAESLLKNFRLNRPGVVLSLLESEMLPVLGVERVEILKGVFNRFPVRPERILASEGRPDLGQYVFTPLATLASLRALASSLDGIGGLLHVARLAAEGAAIGRQSVDEILFRALAHVPLGLGLGARPLTDQEIIHLGAMPASRIRSALEEALAGIEGTLRLSLVPEVGENPHVWSMSRAAQVYVEDPVAPVIRELQDLGERLLTAHENGHLFEHLKRETP